MEKYLLVNSILLITAIILLLVLFIRSGSDKKTLKIEQELQALQRNGERLENALREEIKGNREENSSNAQKGREEQASSLQKLNESLLNRIHQNAALQNEQLESFSKQLGNLTYTNEQRLETVRKTINEQLDAFSRQLNSLTQSNEQKIETVRKTLEEQLKFLQEDNSKKLELMRATVDEKLHATLEKRLGESFQLVSERLELVHKGLGEMQVLAAGVGDLKKVMTNVKTRGVWGEIQLANILEMILTPEQYALNVVTKQGSNDRVEFAIRLPGRGEAGEEVWLPIDAKYPLEDYLRFIDACEEGNNLAAAESGKQMEVKIKAQAKYISDKYLDPPHTTDFAILFLPTESLYAEVVRRPGLMEELQQKYRVNITGPSTMAAFLNSLSLGFKTLAIEKRSSEVWMLLGEVKNEFSQFGDILDKTRKKLQEASNHIDRAATRTRAIERKLRDVQVLPGTEEYNAEIAAAYDEEEQQF
ncbi:MAG TPA: DNA recombination protein RmuC [Syntrophomonadaceae bacterium]|nr:DNA recombination protein RmuC [Syntrophomonadaceae bacterium]HPR93343.1 DNA recombination protein RmuC [Syntrophomonadaceae bacterium]